MITRLRLGCLREYRVMRLLLISILTGTERRLNLHRATITRRGRISRYYRVSFFLGGPNEDQHMISLWENRQELVVLRQQEKVSLTSYQTVAAVDQCGDKLDRVGTVHNLKNIHIDDFAGHIQAGCIQVGHLHMAAADEVQHQLQARSTTFQSSVECQSGFEARGIG
jgi:hypothetical protein